MAELPPNPSAEHLRKQAKRLAKAEGLKLAAAQYRLAKDYGFTGWAGLMHAVDARRRSPLSAAAAKGDIDTVRALLAEGAPVDGAPHERETPLFLACGSDAPAEARLAVANLLIAAGAHLQRGCTDGATALHAAARRGPAALVETLLKAGALAWQGDSEGNPPYDYAKGGAPDEKERILWLLDDGPKIEDPDFRAAVAAIHAGDAAALARLLDAKPSLLTEPAIEPALGPRSYFSDPMLFWFVANNPTLVPAPAPNIAEIAQLMLARGVAQKDLDYTLELVMTDGLMPRPLQMELVWILFEAGAKADRGAVMMTLGHGQTAPIAWLLDHGLPLTAIEAAGLGRTAALARLLETASAGEANDALAMAVINRQAGAARRCLEAGADPNLFMPVHAHSTPLHQAALHGDLEIMKALVAYGARHDIPDKLWRGTALGWAVHCGQPEAEAWLRSLG